MSLLRNPWNCLGILLIVQSFFVSDSDKTVLATEEWTTHEALRTTDGEFLLLREHSYTSVSPDRLARSNSHAIERGRARKQAGDYVGVPLETE